MTDLEWLTWAAVGFLLLVLIVGVWAWLPPRNRR
jgi:hypothetical protein